MSTNKRVFTLRLSDEVFDKIGVLATKEHRSITNYIEYVLLRSFIPKVKSGEMTMEAVKAFLQSQTSYYDYFDDHGRVLKLKRMYHAMYEEDNLCAIS